MHLAAIPKFTMFSQEIGELFVFSMNFDAAAEQ